MTREQRLVALVVIAISCVVLFAVAGRLLAAESTPIGQLSERLFSDVPTSLGAAVPRDDDPAGAIAGSRTAAPRGAGNATARPSISVPVPRATDAAVRGAGRPAAATPLPVIRRGFASWYDAWYGPGLYAAVGHGYRFGQDVYPIVVCTIYAGTSRCVTAIVRDACTGCRDGEPLVDLSSEVWDALGVPLSLGRIRVTVEGLRP